MKKELSFKVSTANTVLTSTVLGLLKNLYKQLAVADLGKTLLIGERKTSNFDETWQVESLESGVDVGFKETEHAIHIIFSHQSYIKK